MKRIRVQLVLAHGIPSRAIGWFGGGDLSHGDIVLPDGSLLGARNDKLKMPSGRVIPAGVEVREPFYEEWKRRFVFYKDVPDVQYELFYRIALSQKHLPYDSTAIWGFASDRDWRTPDCWFCTELIAWVAEKSATLPQLFTPKNKVFPGACATALSAGGWLW